MDVALQRQLSIVIPAFNEEDGIGTTLRGLKAALPEAEVIVVDDGSRDQTRARALAVDGVRVIVHATNRGYGASLKDGMSAAKRRYVAWFDADNEHRVSDLEQMVVTLDTKDIAAVIGRRLSPSVSVVRAVGKFAIRMLARSLGVDVGKDLNCGLRVFRRSVVRRYLPLLPDQFSASLTSTMVFIERGHKIAFHDIHVNPRVGTSKVRIRDGFSTMVLVMRFVMLFAPMRLLFVPGLVALLAGVGYGVARAIVTGRGLPVAAALIAITGLFMAMLGLIADQISQLRFAQLGMESALRDDVFKDPDVFEVHAKGAPEASALAAAADETPPERGNERGVGEGRVELEQPRS
jgi:glycosyltransferase involved in cell wall biosynthesis